ncbi:MAG: hypothetical protein RSG52_05970 [Terrisporobacter sp.]|uniref:hypothetical protein n=1 Tax=Terrisporobacter sp. TaxID=1965305 RepID=UPI002FC68944
MKKEQNKNINNYLAQLEDYYEAAGMQNNFEQDIEGKSDKEILNIYNSIFQKTDNK